jgi:hypothetical protein
LPTKSASPLPAADRGDPSRHSKDHDVGLTKPAGKVDVFTMAGSNDYSALKAHFQAAADAGDPFARRVIAEIYDFCARYSVSPAKFGQSLEGLATIRPEWKAQLADIRATTDQRCAKLDWGDFIPHELLELSWAQAVSSRDPVATLKVAERQNDLSGKNLDQLLDRMLSGADPETLFEVGELLGRNQNSVRYAAFSDPYLGRYTWQIVACRRGGAALCGPRSPLMMSLCMNGICTGTDYEQMVRFLVAGPDQARLNRQIEELERFLSQQAPSP